MKPLQNEFIIFCDGGSRGNPGPAAYACLVTDFSGKTLYQESRAIGIATNNTAEYRGVISALKWLSKNSDSKSKVTISLDSLLVVMQLTGKYRVKSESIRSLYYEAKKIIDIIPAKVVFEHIPREKNQKADILLNQTLDTAS